MLCSFDMQGTGRHVQCGQEVPGMRSMTVNAVEIRDAPQAGRVYGRGSVGAETASGSGCGAW
jgi:hypothetical protein